VRILVSNDDGIHAPGLRALLEALQPLGAVRVVAPEREQSCSGHGITLHKPLRMSRVALPGLDVEAYRSSGTPADCVVLGRHNEAAPPDLVVAGINAGANMGEEVFYSGTVAAALEGCLQGLPAMSVSVTAYENCDFRAAARFAAILAPRLVATDWPEGLFLNVNVPNVAPEEVRGVQVTRLGRRKYENTIHHREDPRGRAYYWFSGEATEADGGAGTDVGATVAGYISVTPVRVEMTGFDAMDAVSGLLDGLTIG
jgi:5'-nucleotidase